MTATLPTANELADAFSAIIREWLTLPELASVIHDNATIHAGTGVCATHDYCDPNQAMIDALEAFGVEWDNDLCELVNAAWDIANANKFGSAPCES